MFLFLTYLAEYSPVCRSLQYRPQEEFILSHSEHSQIPTTGSK